MKLQAPPGMRDFYPESMRLQNWLLDHWRAASRAFGFEEYEGPIFEFLDLYTIKSGPEIQTQLFLVRHGMSEEEKFAIRPEMTPTLARMVAARAQSLPRPIKWFSLPRLCRAERPQRGRLREFFQWNVDILGVDDPIADAEIVAVAVELFRRVGLSSLDVQLRYSSRPLVAGVLQQQGVPAERCDAALRLIDAGAKLTPQAFAESWETQVGPRVAGGRVLELLNTATLEQVLELAAASHAAADTPSPAKNQIQQFVRHLTNFGIADWCGFDLGVVRGLAYYTGIVFEAYPKNVALRALLGGGRYDNLTEMVGGARVPGVGLGAGDAPLFELLAELQRLPTLAERIDVFVVDADPALFPRVLELVGVLRRQGLSVEFSYKRQNLAKQLKQAAQRQARQALIIGQELLSGQQVIVKNLGTGDQTAIDWVELEQRARTTLV